MMLSPGSSTLRQGGGENRPAKALSCSTSRFPRTRRQRQGHIRTVAWQVPASEGPCGQGVSTADQVLQPPLEGVLIQGLPAPIPGPYMGFQQQQTEQQQGERLLEQLQGPGAAGTPSLGGRCKDPALITWRIETALCLMHLQRVVHQDRSRFNAVHISALLRKLVSFADSPPSQWYRPASTHTTHAPKASIRHAQHRRTGPTHNPWQAAPNEDRSATRDWGMSDDDLLEHGRAARGHGTGAASSRDADRPLDNQTKTAAYKQLVSLVDRTACIAGSMATKQQFDATTLSIVFSCLAKLGYGNHQVLNQLLDACPASMPAAPCHALARMVWAAAVLKLQPSPSWMSSWEAAMMSQLQECPPKDLCTSIYALGRLGHRTSARFVSSACSRCSRLLHTSHPQDLANLVSGLAGMRHLPDDTWMREFMAATGPRLRYFQLRALYQTLGALASLGCKPDAEWLTSFYSRCQVMLLTSPGASSASNTAHLSTKQVAGMTASLAKLDCRPDMQWMEACLVHARLGFEQASATDLTQLLAALAALRYRPSSSWMQVFLTCSFRHLSAYTPEQVVSQLQSLARLGHKPPTLWQQELVRKVQARLLCFSGNQLADLLAGLARLQYKPSQEWLSAWECASQSRMDQLSASALAASVWALAEMQHQPSVSWLYSFVLSAYSKLDGFDAGQLGLVFEALPKVSPHPGWLDELVQICASESSPGGRGLNSGSYDDMDLPGGDTHPGEGGNQVARQLQPAQDADQESDRLNSTSDGCSNSSNGTSTFAPARVYVCKEAQPESFIYVCA